MTERGGLNRKKEFRRERRHIIAKGFHREGDLIGRGGLLGREGLIGRGSLAKRSFSGIISISNISSYSIASFILLLGNFLSYDVIFHVSASFNIFCFFVRILN